MAKGHTHGNSAQPEMLSVTTEKGRGITVHNVFTRRLQRSPYPESDVTDYYDVAYLNPGQSAGQTTIWNSTVQLYDHEVPFKVDTRAKVTVISEDQWKSLGMTLHGPDNKPLDV